MFKFAKIFGLLASLVLSTSALAANFQTDNECLNDIENRVEGVTLKLTDCQLQDRHLDIIADYLKAHTDITEIDLMNNELEGSTLTKLALPQIEELELSDNKITDKNAISFAKALKDSTIQFMSFDNNLLTDKAAKRLATLPSLVGLSLAGQVGITDETASVVTYKSNLEIIVVSKTSVSKRGVKTLTKNQNLIGLGVGDLKLPNETTKYISDMHQLQFLDIKNNQITAPGVITISQLSALKALVLSGNKINDEAGASLANLTALIALVMSDTNIGSPTAIAIAKLPNLFILELANNHIDDSGAFELAKTENLFYLNISYNKLSDVGINALKDSHIVIVVADGNKSDIKTKIRQALMSKRNQSSLPKFVINKFIH